jgi:hypothetical protein
MTSGHTRHEARRQRDEDLILSRQLFRSHAPDGRVEVRIVPMICTVGTYSDGELSTPPSRQPLPSKSNGTSETVHEGQGNDGSERGRKHVIEGGWTALRYWLICADCSCSAS